MTLADVLVALVVLSTALLVFLNAFAVSKRGETKGNYYGIASRLANQQLASAQTAGYRALISGTTTYTAATLPGLAALPSGQMTVKVGPVDGNAANQNAAQVDVTVTWGGAGSIPGSVQMSTWVSNNPNWQ